MIPEEAHPAQTPRIKREGNGVFIESQGHILMIGYLIIEAESIAVTTFAGKPVKATFNRIRPCHGIRAFEDAETPLQVKPIKLGQS